MSRKYLWSTGPSPREDETALARCDAVVSTRTGETESTAFRRVRYLLGGKPVFQSFHRPYIFKTFKGKIPQNTSEKGCKPDTGWLAGKRVYAFSGIASNEDFRRTLERLGCGIAGIASFPDHYRYSKQDMKVLTDAAVHGGVKEHGLADPGEVHRAR